MHFYEHWLHLHTNEGPIDALVRSSVPLLVFLLGLLMHGHVYRWFGGAGGVVAVYFVCLSQKNERIVSCCGAQN